MYNRGDSPLTNLGSAYADLQTISFVHEEGLTRRPITRAEFGICGELDLAFASVRGPFFGVI